MKGKKKGNKRFSIGCTYPLKEGGGNIFLLDSNKEVPIGGPGNSGDCDGPGRKQTDGLPKQD